MDIPWIESPLTGYCFVGWSTNGADTSAEWTSGGYTVTSNATFYAVYKKVVTYYDYLTKYTSTYYYPYSVSGNKSITITPEAPAGYTFYGWSTDNDAYAEYIGSTFVHDTLDTCEKTIYAVYYGSIITGGGSSGVSPYGDRLTLILQSTVTTSDEFNSYRETYYDSETGYFNQYHNYNLTAHSGSETSRNVQDYYRLINNGSIGAWQTSVPSLQITLPWTTASQNGYTFTGWSTNGDDTSAEWTNGNHTYTAGDLNPIYYAVYQRSDPLKDRLVYNWNRLYIT